MPELNITGETVEELTAEHTGRWLVTTKGSQHIWDLDDWEYTRFPSEESKSGQMEFDGQPMRINRVKWWPKVGTLCASGNGAGDHPLDGPDRSGWFCFLWGASSDRNNHRHPRTAGHPLRVGQGRQAL